MASFCLAESLVLVSFLGTELVDAPTAIDDFRPAIPREGYLEVRTTTGVAEGLGIFKYIVTADGKASPARAEMSAGATAAAEDLCFLDDLITGDDVEATTAALTEVERTETAVPPATMAA
jgi:hypothetical protein